MSSEDAPFLPALGRAGHWFTPLYQSTVDLFCKDDHVKKLLIEKLPKDEAKVLDIACGTGKLLRMMATAQPCCHFEGMDIDEAMVKTSTQAVAGLTNANVRQGDATSPPFEASSFDAVIESLMFHHITDEQKVQAIKAIWSMLKPGGVFYFVDWVQPQTMFTAFAFKMVQIVDGRTTTEAHANNTVLELIKEHGPFVEAPPHGDLRPSFINTSVGTIGVIPFLRVEDATASQ